MLRLLAVRMLRHRPGSVVATLVALAVGAMVLTAMGVLVESGLSYEPVAAQYAAADVVVARRDATQTSREFDGTTTTSTIELPEGGTVPAELTGKLRAVPGAAAVIADDTVPVTTVDGPAQGHGWSSARLTPYNLVGGSAPGRDDEIVADARLGLDPGAEADLIVAGRAAHVRVSGVAAPASALTGPPAVFFTDARAAALSPHPGRAEVIGVIAAPGADRAALAAAVRGIVGGDGKVYTGGDRGLAERSGDRAARELLLAAGGAFGGYVVMLVVFVVAGTIGLSVRHRRRDLALLRAVAATPGQARRLIMTEAALVSLLAAVLGIPAGLGAARWVFGELVGRGFVPATFPIAPGALAAASVALLTVLSAVLAALIAARRVTRVRPAEALGEAAVEPQRGGPVRLVFGVLTLVGAVTSSSFTLAASGQMALTGAVGMLYLFVTAVALLAPWINALAARALAAPLRAVFGTSGHLAAANLRANARGGAAVLTALVLSVGFGGSVWFVQDNLERGTVTQGRDGMLADLALVSPAGLPASAAEEIRGVPGVRAATGVAHTSVVVSLLGDLEAAPAQVVDPPALAGTLDLRVTAGSLAGLNETGMAVSSVRAGTHGWHVGDKVAVRLGDGTPLTLTVAAIYDRGLGFGDFTLARATVAGHTATGLDDYVLVRADANAVAGDDAVFDRYPGSRLVDAREITGKVGADLALSAWLNRLLIGVMVGYAALAAANVMVMAALARRRELALLRLVGVTRRQASRMVRAEQIGLLGTALLLGVAIAATTLVAVVSALTGSLVPFVPPLGWVVVLGGAAVLALTTTLLPVAALLRAPVMENIGLRE
ncbi:FtsX-like permease family protein [Dactylosporangium sp. CA-233914]|uniref:FtsX-like permease family protein n=1 Tax=Dactylosporangium sp. CA-233914 TaxID=3239934 RepID=UPI003D8A0DCF